MVPKLIIFASGSVEGGGSGFQRLAESVMEGVLKAQIVAVVSNHLNGGVRQKADKLAIPFIHFEAPFTAEKYEEILKQTGAEWTALSGWLKLVSGLDPRTTFNIHPGPLPEFGGKGMYGHFVHEAVLESFKKGEAKHSAVTMHFVTPIYDEGPVFFRLPVAIMESDNAEILGKRVNEAEHKWQPIITNKVVNGVIGWDGKNPSSLFGAELYY